MRAARAALLFLLVVASASEATADSSRVFIHSVPDARTFETYSRTLGADRFGKFVIDVASNEIFYFDVNVYRLHSDFVFGEFYHRPMKDEDINEYNKNYLAEKPRFIFGYLTHHLKTDQWTYSFWEGDDITPRDIRRVRDRLGQTFFQKGLAFRPDSPMQEKKLAELGDLPTLTNDKIYKAAPYQSFNNGVAVGKLRIVPPGAKLEDLLFDRGEIVILQESYPDIAPVAGIVSTVFSTPLSHVNLRAKEWQIPNAGLKDAGTRYQALAGQLVYLEVRDVDHVLRPATDAEVADAQRRAKLKHHVEVPRPDARTTTLLPLDKMHVADVVRYGTKAANLGEIASAHLGVPIPAGFGVPFVFYLEHMKRNHLDRELLAILADPRAASDAAYRKQAYDTLREHIAHAPIDPRTLDRIWAKVQKDLGGAGVFVRSSTNAEDLEGFNGAGLYDTVPNVRSKEQLGDALRQVWASLWNYHAVEERTLFGMDPRQCAVAILVQVGVNASAAGVLITKDLYDPEDVRSYTINAKRGLGLRVVGGTTVPEQVIYDTGNFGTKILSRSDDPTMLVFDDKGGVREVPNDNKGVILTEERAKLLSDTVTQFVPLFSRAFPLDVEWVLEGEKIWIVQSRPYVSR
jgi:hypothetical protein